MGNIFTQHSVKVQCHHCTKETTVDKKVFEKNGDDYKYFCSMSCIAIYNNMNSS